MNSLTTEIAYSELLRKAHDELMDDLKEQIYGSRTFVLDRIQEAEIQDKITEEDFSKKLQELKERL